jgi:hypothetical protein
MRRTRSWLVVMMVACGVIVGCRKSVEESGFSEDSALGANPPRARLTVDRDRTAAADEKEFRDVDEILSRKDLSDDQASGALLRMVTHSGVDSEMRREALRHASVLASDRLLTDSLVGWLRVGLCADPLLAREVLDAARDRDAGVRLRLAAAVRDSTTGPVAEEALELLAVDLESDPLDPEWESELARKLAEAERAEE